MRKMFTAAFLVLSTISTGFAGQTVTFSTDITGANTTIDATHSTHYNFAVLVTGDYTVIGDFTIKAGNSASASIKFDLYHGFDMSGMLLGSSSIAAASVDNQYSLHAFHVAPAPVSLTAGDYSVILHSLTGTNGSQQYFFKDKHFTSDASSFIDISGNHYTAPVVATPEPATLISGGIASLMGLGYALRRRKAKLTA